MAPAYIPAVLTGLATISCIVGMNRVSYTKQASLMSAYAYLNNSYEEYRRKVKEVFGEDADVYRPERWLEGEGTDASTLARMKRSMFQFGAGSRTCIGKNISLMETYKMVPSVLRKFEVCYSEDAEHRNNVADLFTDPPRLIR